MKLWVVQESGCLAHNVGTFQSHLFKIILTTKLAKQKLMFLEGQLNPRTNLKASQANLYQECSLLQKLLVANSWHLNFFSIQLKCKPERKRRVYILVKLTGPAMVPGTQ